MRNVLKRIKFNFPIFIFRVKVIFLQETDKDIATHLYEYIDNEYYDNHFGFRRVRTVDTSFS